jgi:pullulanase/glycogen debranching enzyme
MGLLIERHPRGTFRKQPFLLGFPNAAGSDPPVYRYNFWGYSTVGYFSPMSRYSANVAAGGPPRSLAHEFKSLVRECHKRGIEVGSHMGGVNAAACQLRI